MKPAFDLSLPFGGQIHESLCFRSERGDHCARLLRAWDALLQDINLLGPVFIIMPSTHAVLARVTGQTDFQSCLDEVIDLKNDLHLDPSRIATGLLVEESGAPGQKRVGFQFFDEGGRGLLKILLTNQSRLDWFGSMVDYYVVPPQIPEAGAESHAPSEPAWAEEAEIPEAELQQLWTFFLHHPAAPVLAGTGLDRLQVCRRMGSRSSREVPSRLLGSLLRLAKRYAVPLRLLLSTPGGSFRHDMLLDRIETCGESWHAFGRDGDMHFYPSPGQHYRVSCYPHQGRLDHFLECFDARGNFLGSLGCAAADQENLSIMWNHWLGHLAD